MFQHTPSLRAPGEQSCHYMQHLPVINGSLSPDVNALVDLNGRYHMHLLKCHMSKCTMPISSYPGLPPQILSHSFGNIRKNSLGCFAHETVPP